MIIFLGAVFTYAKVPCLASVCFSLARSAVLSAAAGMNIIRATRFLGLFAGDWSDVHQYNIALVYGIVVSQLLWVAFSCI